jgi:hypothetical protein
MLSDHYWKFDFVHETALTSNMTRRSLTYNLRTPNDFPIDARNTIHNKIIKNGVISTEPTNQTSDNIPAIVHTIFNLTKTHVNHTSHTWSA